MNARPLFQDYKNGRKSLENTLHLEVEFFFFTRKYHSGYFRQFENEYEKQIVKLSFCCPEIISNGQYSH